MAETLLDRLTIFGNGLLVRAIEADRKIASLKRQIENVPNRYSQPDESRDLIEGERRALRDELRNLEELSPALKRVAEYADEGLFLAHPRFIRTGELATESPGYQELFLDCQNAGLVVWNDQAIADVNHDAANTSYGRS